MRYILVVMTLSLGLYGQNFAVTSFVLPKAPRPPFWSSEQKVEAGILAGLVAADAITTQRGLNEGLREGNPIMRPFVTRGAAGEAAGSALGFGAGMGLVYLLHRSHHYRAERITMSAMVFTESGFVVNNIVVLH